MRHVILRYVVMRGVVTRSMVGHCRAASMGGVHVGLECQLRVLSVQLLLPHAQRHCIADPAAQWQQQDGESENEHAHGGIVGGRSSRLQSMSVRRAC